MLKKILLGLLLTLVVVAVGLAGFVAYALQPKDDILPLPEGLVALTAPSGKDLLRDADAKADYPLLADSHQSQDLTSYCGVASGVTVLNALGMALDQDSFFDTDKQDVKSRFGVMFGGMTLSELTAFLSAHDGLVQMQHADSVDVDEFRRVVKGNLLAPDDFLLVNYQREVLGQRRSGHISPVAAYDAESDSVLILDTAAYKYPSTWVPLAALHAAMNTIDPSSGKSRGFVEVSRKPN